MTKEGAQKWPKFHKTRHLQNYRIFTTRNEITEDEIDSIRHTRRNVGALNAPGETLFANPQFP